MGLRVVDHDFGEDAEGQTLEAFYTEHAAKPLMAVSRGVPRVARRARELEGHGYRRRPPSTGRKFCFAAHSVEDVDWGTVRALRGVLDEMEPAWIAEIQDACRISNEPRLIAAWCELPLQIVIAALLDLEARGELPTG